MNNNMDIEKLAYNHGANIYENGEVRFYTLNAFTKFAEAYHQAKCNEELQTLRAKVASAEMLVEALRGAENIVKSAILLEGEIEPHISESTYELNGCLGENAANISVRGRGVLNKITEALATYDKLSEVKE